MLGQVCRRIDDEIIRQVLLIGQGGGAWRKGKGISFSLSLSLVLQDSEAKEHATTASMRTVRSNPSTNLWSVHCYGGIRTLVLLRVHFRRLRMNREYGSGEKTLNYRLMVFNVCAGLYYKLVVMCGVPTFFLKLLIFLTKFWKAFLYFYQVSVIWIRIIKIRTIINW